MEVDFLQWEQKSRKDSTDLAADITSLGPAKEKAVPLSPDDQFELTGNSTTATHFRPPTVQFSGLSKSPIIELPPLSISDNTESSANESSAPSSAVFLLGSQPGAASSTRLRLNYLVFANLGQLIHVEPVHEDNHEDNVTVVNSHIACVYVGDGTKSIE
ncbi:unnamed protein product [Cylicocyclus nassatus]|uniref:Uncharacterized protein n=1 Tax=Cylicocyclus nassatus TaxID=53992 RepID=A0AA36HCK0_CYLNA|nr:unnamed protein product [Cylicocyclus nassatus]